MKKTFIVVALHFVFISVFSQTWQQADSLRQVYQEKQNFDTALIYAERALELAELEFGKRDTLCANILSSLLQINFYLGKYQAAIEYGLQEKEIREKAQGEDHSSYGACLNNLAVLYCGMGQYDKGLPLYLEALENTEMSLGRDHPEYGNCLNNLAVLYKEMGQYDKALQLSIEALEYTEKATGKDHSYYGFQLNTLASVYKEMGQYDKALPLYLEALENIEKSVGKEHQYYGTFLNSLTTLYIIMGQYDKALPLALEALQNTEKSLGKDHSEYGLRLNILGIIYQRMGQYEEALPLYIEALENIEKSLGKEHWYYGTYLGNIAIVYEKMGQYDKALPLFLEALENTEKSLGKEHSKYGIRLCNLANLYYDMGQYDKALSLYLEALENTEKYLGKEHPLYGSGLNNLAILYLSMRQYDKALPLYRDAIKNNFYNINRAFSFLAENEKEKFIKTLSESFNSYKSFFLNYAPQNPEVACDAYNIELATKGIILQAGIQMREAIQNSSDSISLYKYDKWQVLRLTIAKQYSQPVNKRLQNLPDMEAEAEALEGELARVSSAFAESQRLGAITWQDVQHLLTTNEACVEFSSFAYKKDCKDTDSIMYVALVLLPGSEQPILVPLCEQRQLDSILVQSISNKNSLNRMYRATIFPENNTIDYGRRLYELIWQPIEKHLQQTKTVYFAPSGSLHKIAFAAIPVDNKTRLSDKYKLIQLSTTAVLTKQSKYKSNSTFDIALFGGINYDTESTELLSKAEKFNNQDYVSRSMSGQDSRGGSSWGYLPGTLKEVTNIEQIAIKKKIKVNLFTGNDAMEEQFKFLNGANSPQIIHIATHGFFFEDIEQGDNYDASKNPLNRAGLLFAGANNYWQGKKQIEGLEDGILTAYEASNLSLINTELIVLSACETGLGEIRGSEGVFGLQRAFKNAGVEYIMMSLWKVPDAETAEFMEPFYKKLFSGKTIPDAFLYAQHKMKKKYPDEPYKWAAFVLVR